MPRRQVTQEDAWAVISAYFEEKGLVRQQLDSFDEFIQNTMQELVDDSGSIRVSPEIQHSVGYDEAGFDQAMSSDTKKVFEVRFGQVYLSKPTTVEKDGTVTNMFPHEARLRNLTYAAPLYVDVTMNEYRVRHDANVGDPAEDMGQPVSTEEARKEFLGYVPIMLRSLFCVLSDKDDAQLADLGEAGGNDPATRLAYSYGGALPKDASSDVDSADSAKSTDGGEDDRLRKRPRSGDPRRGARRMTAAERRQCIRGRPRPRTTKGGRRRGVRRRRAIHESPRLRRHHRRFVRSESRSLKNRV